MKAQKGTTGIALLFFNLGSRRGWVGVQRRSAATLLPGERLSTQCTKDCVGPRGGQNGCGKPRAHRDSIRRPSRSSKSTI